MPWYAKVTAAAVVAYALSPVDLIPDFIPVLGYLDDLVVVPLGLLLVRRLMSPPVLEEYRSRDEAITAKRVSHARAAVVVIVWILLASLTTWLLLG